MLQCFTSKIVTAIIPRCDTSEQERCEGRGGRFGYSHSGKGSGFSQLGWKSRQHVGRQIPACKKRMANVVRSSTGAQTCYHMQEHRITREHRYSTWMDRSQLLHTSNTYEILVEWKTNSANSKYTVMLVRCRRRECEWFVRSITYKKVIEVSLPISEGTGPVREAFRRTSRFRAVRYASSVGIRPMSAVPSSTMTSSVHSSGSAWQEVYSIL